MEEVGGDIELSAVLVGGGGEVDMGAVDVRGVRIEVELGRPLADGQEGGRLDRLPARA